MIKTQSWSDPSRYIRQIHVEEKVLELDYTKEILKRTNLPVNIVSEGQTPQGIPGKFPDNLTIGKKHLFLCENKGTFFKPCPATTCYQCCDYQVLNIGMNCPIDCVYCILQAYLNKPWISAFVNIDKLFNELDQSLTAEPDRFFRIGTGEFSDSLALDNITGLSSKIVEYFAQRKNAVLELKTKSAAIDQLQHADHRGRTILSWSLNSPIIMKKEEIRSASFKERLEAASRAASWGYRLAFHFDPIIIHKDWKEGYSETIRQLFRKVPKESIAWISLGALRYLPSLKGIGTSRFPHSRIFYQEFVAGLDGKSRYFRAQRENLYQHIHEQLTKNISSDTCLYFCMESDEIWQKVFGYSPDKKGGIPAMLDKAALAAAAKF
jgi:spore photoproduct lyase